MFHNNKKLDCTELSANRLEKCLNTQRTDYLNNLTNKGSLISDYNHAINIEKCIIDMNKFYGTCMKK